MFGVYPGASVATATSDPLEPEASGPAPRTEDVDTSGVFFAGGFTGIALSGPGIDMCDRVAIDGIEF
jgi:hypothetical protein